MLSRPFFLQKHHMQRTFYNLSRNIVGDLYIVRHAECDHNLGGYCAGFNNSSLPTIDGLMQAHMGGKLLASRGVKFDALYVSPIERALISAHTLIHDLPSIEITPIKALAERNFGAFTGMSKNQIQQILSPEEFHNYIHDKNFLPPDIRQGHQYFQSKDFYGAWPENHKAESFQCVINRLRPFLEKVTSELLKGQNIIIVGHSHNLQILQMLLYGHPFEQGIEKYKLQHATPIRFILSLNSENKLIVNKKVNLFKLETDSMESREFGRLSCKI